MANCNTSSPAPSPPAARRHERRPLTVDELLRLLETTEAGPDRLGMTGRERVLLYRLAVETGLRSGELRSLTRAPLDLDADMPTVTVGAAYSKRRKRDALPLRPDTALALRTLLSQKTPAALVFNMPGGTEVIDMLRADLNAAGIPYRDEAGRVADFHALRHTLGTLLAASGTHPKVAQSLMRHSYINLTMSLYSHSYREDEAAAVGRLPDLSHPGGQHAVATGTEDAFRTRSCLGVLLGATGATGRGAGGLRWTERSASGEGRNWLPGNGKASTIR